MNSQPSLTLLKEIENCLNEMNLEGLFEKKILIAKNQVNFLLEKYEKDVEEGKLGSFHKRGRRPFDKDKKYHR